ncbi:hypothetical protein [Streptomyces sp. NPDC021020]|uniref:hypothetical protein n=1 Tax=Streptomyces sp. NPDC021020 TaxID=3365109 RepID=UPI0037ACA649
MSDQPRREPSTPPEGSYPPDRWSVRWHVPYFVRHRGRIHLVVARTSAGAAAAPAGGLRVYREGETVSDHPGLVAGSTVDLLGKRWRVAHVEHRVHIVLDRVSTEGDAGPRA